MTNSATAGGGTTVISSRFDGSHWELFCRSVPLAGLTVLILAGFVTPYAVIPLGLLVITAAVGILWSTPATQCPGVGYGLAGLMTAAVGLAVAIAVLALSALAASATAAASPISPAAVALRPTQVSASSFAPPSTTASGQPVTFEPEHLIDGDTTTAWRVAGDGVGSTINIAFSGAVHLTEIGLIPGYAKVDPTDGTDRWSQNGRVARARFTFTDGQTIDVDYSDTPQWATIGVNVTTASVRMTVLATRPGTRGYTAVSEIAFAGSTTG